MALARMTEFTQVSMNIIDDLILLLDIFFLVLFLYHVTGRGTSRRSAGASRLPRATPCLRTQQ